MGFDNYNNNKQLNYYLMCHDQLATLMAMAKYYPYNYLDTA